MAVGSSWLRKIFSRRVAVAVLITLATIVVLVGALTVWAKRQLLETDTLGGDLEPVPRERRHPPCRCDSHHAGRLRARGPRELPAGAGGAAGPGACRRARAVPGASRRQLPPTAPGARAVARGQPRSACGVSPRDRRRVPARLHGGRRGRARSATDRAQLRSPIGASRTPSFLGCPRTPASSPS